MSRLVLAFIVVFGLFFFGIRAVREMTVKDMWSMYQLLTYSLGCALLTLATLIALVVIF